MAIPAIQEMTIGSQPAESQENNQNETANDEDGTSQSQDLFQETTAEKTG